MTKPKPRAPRDRFPFLDHRTVGEIWLVKPPACAKKRPTNPSLRKTRRAVPIEQPAEPTPDELFAVAIARVGGRF